jgi:hypothetical protein
MEVSFYTRDGKQIAIMKKIMFNDRIERYICTHDHIPEDYWPKTVFIKNTDEYYNEIGTYSINSTKSTQSFNLTTEKWEGEPSVKTYYFHPK